MILYPVGHSQAPHPNDPISLLEETIRQHDIAEEAHRNDALHDADPTAHPFYWTRELGNSVRRHV